VHAVRAVSEAANFPSREAVAAPPAVAKPEEKRELRRYRTGRNVQLNIKVKPETLETFYKIADEHGWGARRNAGTRRQKRLRQRWTIK